MAARGSGEENDSHYDSEEEEDDDQQQVESDEEEDEADGYSDDDEDEDDEDEDDEDAEEEKETEQQRAMRNVPLGERLRLHQEAEPATIHRKRKDLKKKKKLEREGKEDDGAITSRPNKNFPAVISSKKKVGRFREIGQPTRPKARDPRFDDLSGRLNYDRFFDSYQFLDEQQEKELAKLKKVKKRMRGEKQEAVAATVAKTQQQIAERRRALRVKEKIRQKKKEEQEAVAQGKNPYFLKKSAIKQIALEDRYAELKQQGKLEKFLQKKRKRNAAKDHRWLPSRRVRTEEP